MSESNDPVYDSDDAAAARSSGGQGSVDGLALAWARQSERDRSDQMFDALVRAAESELLTTARSIANRLVGPDDAEDVINTVWAKLWRKQRPPPAQGPAERGVGADDER